MFKKADVWHTQKTMSHYPEIDMWPHRTARETGKYECPFQKDFCAAKNQGLDCNSKKEEYIRKQPASPSQPL